MMIMLELGRQNRETELRGTAGREVQSSDQSLERVKLFECTQERLTE